MPKQTESTSTIAITRQKSEATSTHEPVAASVATPILDSSLIQSFQINKRNQINPKLQRIQRQILVDKISRVRGNGHLEQVLIKNSR